MTDIDKHKIASSFPDKFEQSNLGIEISSAEYKTFKDGIFANSMDDKWNVFVWDNTLYLARSWKGFCIYKVFIKRQGDSVLLSSFQVNRDENQYRSKDIQYDIKLLRKLLQMFLRREDFYSDSELELPLIKATIQKVDPNNECKKSIGSNNVGLTRQIHNRLTTNEQKKYCDVIGWTELRERIANKNDDEPLLSLYLQNRNTNSAATYYFDKDANEFLGEIIITNKLGSS